MTLPRARLIGRLRWQEVTRGAWSAQILWEPRDLWIGAFVKRERHPALAPASHVYICAVPTIVFHFTFVGRRAK